MLNTNDYDMHLPERFVHGFNFNLFSSALNRYDNGQYRGMLSVGMLESSGTGHWPFTLFDYRFITGPLGSWQVTLFGFVIGSKKVHDIDQETGKVVGKDKKMLYSFFSCLNHKGKTLEEIIQPTI